MWLIIGGAYQGKLEYAKNQKEFHNSAIVEGADCTLEDLKKASLINQFHLWIKRMMEEQEDIYKMLNQILSVNTEVVIIMNELGCGIVPMDAFDREYRETVGRVGCYLAKQAEQVHLVTCGIGRVIKNAD